MLWGIWYLSVIQKNKQANKQTKQKESFGFSPIKDKKNLLFYNFMIYGKCLYPPISVVVFTVPKAA